MVYRFTILILLVCLGAETSYAQNATIQGEWTYKTFVGIEKIDPTTRAKMEFVWKMMKLNLNEDGTYTAKYVGELTNGEYKASKKKIVFKDAAGKFEHQVYSITEDELVMQFNKDGLVVVLQRKT